LANDKSWSHDQQTYWDQEARSYDGLYLGEWSRLEDKLTYNVIRPQLRAEEPNRLLDLGCGTGVIASLLKEREHSFVYLGVDISPQMLKIARRKHPDLEFRQVDVDELSPDLVEHYNIVIGLNGLLSYSFDAAELIRDLLNSMSGNTRFSLSFYGRWSIHRLIRFRFGRTGRRATRNSTSKGASNIRYYSTKDIERVFDRVDVDAEISFLGKSALGRVAEYPPLWKLDRFLCKIWPDFGHTIIVSGEVRK